MVGSSTFYLCGRHGAAGLMKSADQVAIRFSRSVGLVPRQISDADQVVQDREK